MNSAKTPKTDDISLLRAQIDEFDAQIANLLVKRTEISQMVAASKANDAKIAGEELGFGWRPKREVEIIRQVLRREPTLGKRLSYMVWRAMITRNLANQAPMDVICVKESQAPSRIGFGAAVIPKLVETPLEALKIGQEKENLIISLPWPNGTQNWWVELLNPEFAELKINMLLPHIEGTIPEALCLAKIEPLETGNDFSIIAAKFGANLPESREKINENNNYELWVVKGFHKELEKSDAGVHFLGAYAIV